MEGIVICDSTLHSVYSKLNQTLKGRLEAAWSISSLAGSISSLPGVLAH